MGQGFKGFQESWAQTGLGTGAIVLLEQVTTGSSLKGFTPRMSAQILKGPVRGGAGW